jgi:hypothetical protein
MMPPPFFLSMVSERSPASDRRFLTQKKLSQTGWNSIRKAGDYLSDCRRKKAGKNPRLSSEYLRNPRRRAGMFCWVWKTPLFSILDGALCRHVHQSCKGTVSDKDPVYIRCFPSAWIYGFVLRVGSDFFIMEPLEWALLFVLMWFLLQLEVARPIKETRF